MSNIISADGWNNMGDPNNDKKVYFGEHRCFGDGENQMGRVPYSKQLTDSQASHFTSISYIDGDEWLH
ncbi:hypothetical protein DY000_02035449 [Brassica cretica]|uniref:Pectinesterase n=1 Tax=Brassica cretica TaxID=69181 RepID=A0ABQ7DZS5_BRACR|nr:hypothetical protein DY000_02035449 [Brassica cretica]